MHGATCFARWSKHVPYFENSLAQFLKFGEDIWGLVSLQLMNNTPQSLHRLKRLHRRRWSIQMFRNRQIFFSKENSEKTSFLLKATWYRKHDERTKSTWDKNRWAYRAQITKITIYIMKNRVSLGHTYIRASTEKAEVGDRNNLTQAYIRMLEESFIVT